MSYLNCDNCGKSNYTRTNPFVELRIERPSDSSDLCCVMAGHQHCFRIESIPDIGESGGTATPEQWENYILSEEAIEKGHVFLT